MKLHTVFITYNRLELTKQAIASYLETVKGDVTFVVVDNASTDGTREWMNDNWPFAYYSLPENRYPGYATNFGWESLLRVWPDAEFLHRADNDFAFVEGWCEEVERVFEDENVGQVGLRTDEEEESSPISVGGNCVIRRELWDKGLRFDERPWSEFDPGWTEDNYLSMEVNDMGYLWTRVQRPCIVPLDQESPDDPYYVESWRSRGILEWAFERHGRLPPPCS